MSQPSFRVLSYNIHKGFTFSNREFVLEKIREAIREVAPDFVFLQEVLGEHRTHSKKFKNWPLQSQFEYMADELWPHFAYGKNAIYDDGHHGNAILSRFPLLRWENEDISSSSLERRGILHAVVKPFKHRPELHLVCTHFGLFEKDRKIQARKMCERLRQSIRFGDGLIVAGDFNDWSLKVSKIFRDELGLHEAHHVLHRRHARTFPAQLPLLRLDRIYFHGPEARASHCLHKGNWSTLSDHAALVADFGWP